MPIRNVILFNYQADVWLSSFDVQNFSKNVVNEESAGPLAHPGIDVLHLLSGHHMSQSDYIVPRDLSIDTFKLQKGSMEKLILWNWMVYHLNLMVAAKCLGAFFEPRPSSHSNPPAGQTPWKWGSVARCHRSWCRWSEPPVGAFRGPSLSWL